ncbi:MAG: flagellar biosynthetic protein FliR [Elusimicrobia bacterium RIFOXYB2_FULL_49_7]|nr:MAG: flagellar biosynthetic protein FliR [Elusimicrobia bacterium RIFOXYB2_FULL_49_7]
MQTVADVTVDQILCFLMALTRIGTMMAVFPILGSRSTPVMAKAAFALALTIILFPLIPAQSVVLPTGVFSFTVVVIKEMMIGMVLGFAGSLFFAVIQFGGKIIDQEMAFAMTDAIDPVTETETTATGQFFTILFSIIFLLIGGHHIFIRAMAYSFEKINVGQVTFASGPIAKHLVKMTADIFILGLKFASPIMATLILTTVILGIIARTLPQLNIFIVGLPLKIGIGFIVIITCLPGFNTLFQSIVFSMKDDLYLLMKLMS